jgi:glycine betaine/proline transport system substrate-binding protein
MFAEFSQKAKAGEPAIMYTWTPAPYTAQVIPGVDVMWISMNNASVLDDSNPLDKEGGAEYDQGEGFGSLGDDTCLVGPDGCQLGWEAADIEITANAAWLDENPAALALFEAFKPSVFDVSLALVELDASDGSQADVERIAAQWISDNRDQVDGWLEAARAAG